MTIHLTPSAVLRPLELPARADAGPTPLLRAYAEVRNRTIKETSGREDDALSPEELLPVLYDSIASKKRQWCIEEDGETIGCVATAMLQDGDADTALGVISILKARTGRGIGTAALTALEGALRVEGIRHLMGWVEHHGDGSDMLHSPTGFGAVPRDGAARFLDRRGFRLEQVVRTSAWSPDAASLAHLRRARETAQAHASDYRVVQWMLPTPDEFVEGYAWMKSRMSTDVPDAELGTPVEVWDTTRVRELEAHHAAKGFAVQVTAAQHVATGELCAFNELAIRASDPADTSHQHDTLVLAGHRGHRLGMLVKTAGLLGWHARYPRSPKVLTYNAEENRPMLDINETLGFAPIAYEGAWKKELK
ncbi:GNAT family N-acetyltransferase [uncultured Microbacterium sp.]|uniref:GNAT family N-acetyltransferase n=1 Tax=uncultured Microbacterium sp. TaxID=191216 RepID=UPI002611B729|nr:GNAT family N-acetyltransferase [uncultured Microbacterium sp.]